MTSLIWQRGRAISLGVGFVLALAPSARAEDAAKPAAPPAAASGNEAEDVDVNLIKKKYWATGDESELGVVQNRLYSKANKFEIALQTGVAFGDPFLSIKPIGLSAGYNFNEIWGLDAFVWSMQNGPSSALTASWESGKSQNINPPKTYYGAEGTANILYGKLSLVGQKIIYYDFYFSGGGGMMMTENGNRPTASLGLGQRFYVNRWFALKLDYKMLVYSDPVNEQVIPQLLGTSYGNRTNFTHAITLGLDFMF